MSADVNNALFHFSHDVFDCGTCNPVTKYDILMNESIHRASPVHSQQKYIATGLTLYKNILLPAIHKASPVYSQMGYIGTGLVNTVTHSTDGTILLPKLLVQSN